MTTTLDDILAFARDLTAVPYEAFSRFLRESPRHLRPAEVPAHIAQGWGLTCREKSQLMADYLSACGTSNAIVSAAFEQWSDGVNLLQFKGTASQPPNEAFISRFFEESWSTSVYETPLHLSHWANAFEVDHRRFLVDTTGNMAPFRCFQGSEATRLLDDSPKPYVTYLPTGVRVFFHRLSRELLGKVDQKHLASQDYMAGKLLATALVTTERAFVNLKWWWRDSALEHDVASAPELTRRLSRGEMELVFCETLADLFAALPEGLPDRYPEALEQAWPAIQGWVARVFDAPKHVRFMVSRSKAPMSSYSSNQLLLDG